MSQHKEEDRLTQPVTVDLYDSRNQLRQEIDAIENATFTGQERTPGELAEIKRILPDLVEKWRTSPQVPIKHTANTGGEEPLQLDFLGMYRFQNLKILEALRLNPQQFMEDSYKARQVVAEVLAAQSKPVNMELIGFQQKCLLEIQEETINGINVQDALTATVYAERLAAVGAQLGITPGPTGVIPPYETYVAEINAQYVANSQISNPGLN